MAVCIKDCIQNMNLVIGCTIGCSYCYARNNVRRFHMIDDFEKPEFFPNKLRLMEKKRPQNFLLTGMSDFSHWKPEWREQIFDKMTENPQHQYLFLTKRPENIVFSTTLENAWFGVTVTSSKEKNRIRTLREHIHCGHYHVTFEPMFDDVGMVDLTGIEWIVIEPFLSFFPLLNYQGADGSALYGCPAGGSAGSHGIPGADPGVYRYGAYAKEYFDQSNKNRKEKE